MTRQPEPERSGAAEEPVPLLLTPTTPAAGKPAQEDTPAAGDRRVFISAATYADRARALEDYESLIQLPGAKLIGAYDVAIVSRDSEGTIHVEKHQKPALQGAWGGVAVGALVSVLFPPSVIGSAAAGGLVGGLSGHLRKGISRKAAKDLGETLKGSEAALMIIGDGAAVHQLNGLLEHADQSIEREIYGDSEQLKQALGRERDAAKR